MWYRGVEISNAASQEHNSHICCTGLLFVTCSLQVGKTAVKSAWNTTTTRVKWQETEGAGWEIWFVYVSNQSYFNIDYYITKSTSTTLCGCAYTAVHWDKCWISACWHAHNDNIIMLIFNRHIINHCSLTYSAKHKSEMRLTNVLILQILRCHQM